MEVAKYPVIGRYDLGHFQEFHRRLFGDVYPWAGEIRSVSISKVQMFCLPHLIEGEAERIFHDLAGESFLRDLKRPEFVEKLVRFMAEINALHPFREGNGRTLRSFFDQLSREAGHTIAWPDDAKQNNQAFIRAMSGDMTPLAELLEVAVLD